jgi:hypothetical protein
MTRENIVANDDFSVNGALRRKSFQSSTARKGILSEALEWTFFCRGAYLNATARVA